MGSQIFKQANQVDIMQSGGCAGGGDCNMGEASFDQNMDPMLQPYLTQQEYKQVLDEATVAVRVHGVKWYWWVSGIPIFIICGVLFSLAKSEKFLCTAANGACRDGQSPAADQCCSYTCCPAARRLEELNTAADFLSPSGAEEDTTRSLLTRRRMAAFGCFTDEPTEETECMCREEGSGKSRTRVCDGKITVDGAYDVVPPVVWPIPIAVIGYIVGSLMSLVYPVWKLCALKGKIHPILEPWRQKGLSAEYRPGSKHAAARITVFTPAAGAQVLGTVAGTVVK